MGTLGFSETSEIFQSNLRALEAIGSDLATRLKWLAADDHIRVGKTGGIFYLHQGRPHRLDAQAQALQAATPSTFIFGIGLGEQVQNCLDTPEIESLVAWERDPFLMKLFLSRHDLSAALLSGRLTLKLASDLWVFLRGGLPDFTLFHPLLGQIYTQERYLVEHGVGHRCVAMGLGGLFVDDMVSGIHELGFDTFPVDLHRWSEEEIALTLDHIDAEFLAVINYTVGLGPFCRRLGRPLIVWEIDPCTDKLPAHEGDESPTHIFTYRHGNQIQFKQAGFQHVEYLPLASNPLKRKPIPASKNRDYQIPLSFVGSSMVAQANRHKDRFLKYFAALNGNNHAAYQAGLERLTLLLANHRQNFSQNLLPQLMAHYFPNLQAQLSAAGMQSQVHMLVGELVAAEKRLNYAAHLADRGLHVFGDAHWKMTEASGVNYRGPAGHHLELTRIYSGSAINIDINRIYQPDIVTMRVFDVLACGGFLIAEYSEALSQLFAIGDEVECHRSLDELKDKVDFYQRNPQAAKTIAKRGLTAVRERHTILCRLEYMIQSAAKSPNHPAPNPLTGWVKMETRPSPILWG